MSDREDFRDGTKPIDEQVFSSRIFYVTEEEEAELRKQCDDEWERLAAMLNYDFGWAKPKGLNGPAE